MLGLQTVAYAQQAGDAAATAGAGTTVAATIVSFFPFILIFAVMYLMLIRPQKKKEKILREKISKMKVGDKVVSIGGIVGKVSKIKDEFVIIETGNVGTPDERSFIKFEKAAIKDIQVKESN